MRKAPLCAALTVAAGLALPVAAQDSTAIAGAGNSDAVKPFAISEQFNDYVVDLFPFMTSGGHTFGIAPLVKSHQIDPAFANSLLGAQGFSRNLIMGAEPGLFGAPTFGEWFGPGVGVNDDPARNAVPGSFVMPTGTRNMFSTAFVDFGLNTNSIVTAVTQIRPTDPSRLYVKRIVSAVNDEDGSERESTLNMGGVDAMGNVHFRGDTFNVFGTNPIVGNNYIRVRSLDRNPAMLNVILDIDPTPANATGGTDGAVTDAPLDSSGVTHSVPSILPESLYVPPVGVPAGTVNSPMLGSNFNTEYVYEATPGTMTGTLAHVTASPLTRGNVQFTPLTFGGLGASVGTGTMLGRGPNLTDMMMAWAIKGDGSVGGALEVPRAAPGGAPDNSPLDPFAFPYQMEFTNYQSQVPFQGGNGQVAVGRDPQGLMMLAAAFSFADVSDPTIGGTATEAEGGILVARFDPANPAAVQYGLAAWNEFNSFLGLPNEGKGIYDSGGVRIGELALFDEITGGLAPFGPSFSSPMFDAGGNVWFLGAAQLYRDLDDDLADPLDTAVDDFDVVLLRGVFDPANFSWQLELVMEPGNIFTGVNSTTDYMVTFISLVDSNSISSGAPTSGNIAPYGHNGAPQNNYAPADPRNLGGIIINAEIVYDVDGDGMFDEWDSVNNPTGVDQGYQTLLYIGALDPGCLGDFNFDGMVGGADLAFLLASWGSAFGPADLNGDGVVDGADLAALLASWGPC